MNTSNIKSFSVQGLFGTDDVHIPFDENTKILVGENGLGKTQVLNLFYYTLKRNFFRLGEFSFDKLILEFSQKNPIEISKDKVNELIQELYDHPVLRDFIDQVGYPQLEMLRNRFIQSKGKRRKFSLEAELEFEYNLKSSKFPVNHIFRVFERLEINRDNQSNLFFRDCAKDIESGIEETEIMYFPTYRRVEEDLYNLGYSDDELLNQENTLIQFGMDDVQKRFNKIQNDIDGFLKEGFSQMSSEILSQLIEDEEDEKDSEFLKNIEDNDVAILLSRVGNRISEQKKEKISELLLTKETKLIAKDNSLNFFLKKLIEIYSSQKELDKSVKLFRDVCNKYLINKKVFYDESEIKIFIKSERNSSDIPLSKLSSGEKQIISIFSKIYLSEGDKKFVVLFDEPELSLSMPWQKQLLPDILNSGKCEFLLAVTHSPFIFDNELDKYAIGLNEYIQPSQVITA
ncbi:AAA family ATPase [Microcoleus sp. LEGE 07076]|uniref:AAA family ATPase n=1 Tax=Microcoleus sp. LEGE 07076 TaxID=915322 RepID=UPI001882CC21|nr:AAA family ATPase [Microcoleus sp. LEGE 07076]MBE9183873.1 AAA family ATPase [Microcoleus sp. LEGE 07076]